MLLNVQQIAEYTRGSLVSSARDADRLVSGITWDSRAVEADCLYVALPGERVDGHDFVGAAIDAGAAAVLTMRAIDKSAMEKADRAGAAVVRVADTARAIADLARGWRSALTGKVVVVTGSSGKTTTKNLIRDVLSSALSVVATQANQNNELGVPRTLLNASADTQAVVVEIGMRGAGQIKALCAYVRPDYGVVTNVGTSHIELLGSRENIARAKGELVEALDAGGVAFLNAHDAYTDFICDKADTTRREIEVVRFSGEGAGVGAEVFASDVVLDEQGRPSFLLHTPTGVAPCKLALRGAHNVDNACAAAAVAGKFGMSADAIAEALGGAEAMSGRQDIMRNALGVTVVDDSYNANPDSMKASLAMFASLAVPGRRVAVLGDMGELGSFSQEGHEQVGRLAADADLDDLICVGDLSRFIARAAQDAGMPSSSIRQVSSAQGALDALDGLVGTGDAVLVKASHSMGLEDVVEGLMA